MFYITQLVMCLFAYSFAHFQEAIIKERIAYVPPYGNKYNKDFHKFGAAIALSLGLMAALTIMPDVKWALVNLLLNGMCYTLVFDLVIGFEVYDNPFYMGTTSKLDKIWKKGKVKAGVLAIIIITINALKLFL
jgi:hypothetical protein